MVDTFAVGLAFLVVGLSAIGIFVYVAKSAKHRREFSELIAPAGKLRKIFFVVLLSALVIFYLISIPWMPYPPKGEELPKVKVKVVGKMFYWKIEPTEVPANTPIVFEVTSGDVNHGFGIYDPQGNLIAQTQAMPNYINRLVVTFDKPGEYRILCLEYCGFMHHNMVGKIRVVEK